MMNGDVITTLDFGELLDTHVSSGNALTIATQVRTATIDFGVLRLGERTGSVQQVVGYLEKPHSDYVVSMGVYVVSPHLLQLIEPDAYLDFPDLVLQALGASERVGSYNYDGLWLDIGRHEDYERAIAANPDIPSVLRQASRTNGRPPRPRLPRRPRATDAPGRYRVARPRRRCIASVRRLGASSSPWSFARNRLASSRGAIRFLRSSIRSVAAVLSPGRHVTAAR